MNLPQDPHNLSHIKDFNQMGMDRVKLKIHFYDFHRKLVPFDNNSHDWIVQYKYEP